jgi:phosphoribosyl 1,2-cyclic phosphodiesterase
MIILFCWSGIMKITLFSSGSCGNCGIVCGQDVNIMIDAGLSKKQIDAHLENSGLDFTRIDYLFITHSHMDHIKGLAMILKKTNTIVFMSDGTYSDLLKTKDKIVYEDALYSKRIYLFKKINFKMDYETLDLNEFLVEPIPTFHDASESCGYIITKDNKKIVYITDTGYVHTSLFNKISNANCYVLESNHDPQILMSDPIRPLSLKIRILSDHGHLSNEDSMVVLAKVKGEKTKLVFHAHISQDCNLTQIVNLTRERVFNDYGINTETINFVITSPYRTEEYLI